MEKREIVIVGTKGIKQKDSDYLVLTKDEVIKRIPELLDENVGYTILVATKDGDIS